MSTDSHVGGNAAEKQVKYPIDGKGLIVVARQINHNVIYRDEVWTKKVMNYEADEKRILKLFQIKAPKKGVGKIFEYLTAKKEGQKPKADVITGTDLTNGMSNDSFFAFMQQVKAHKVNKPSFLMFFLMSHGFENGEFLLAAKGKDVNGKMEPEGPCCGEKTATDDHKLEGECYGRHIVKDIIQEVGKTYTDIPKIFILQCCRGGNCCVVSEGCADKPVATELGKADAELFIPENEDTLVLRSCVEGSTCWVAWDNEIPDEKHTQGGSLLIQSFCRSMEELERANREYGKIKQRLHVTKLNELAGHLQDRREDLIGGWMMNVCQRTTAFVTNYMYIKLCLLPTPLGCLLELSERKMKSGFTRSLEKHKADSKHGEGLQRLLDICNSKHPEKRKPRVNAMVQYLYNNVPDSIPHLPLGDEISKKKQGEVTEILDSLIAEMRDNAEQIPLDKQQPHISSFLSKKLSCLDMIQSS